MESFFIAQLSLLELHKKLITTKYRDNEIKIYFGGYNP
jgi:hypothetical protein